MAAAVSAVHATAGQLGRGRSTSGSGAAGSDDGSNTDIQQTSNGSMSMWPLSGGGNGLMSPDGQQASVSGHRWRRQHPRRARRRAPSRPRPGRKACMRLHGTRCAGDGLNGRLAPASFPFSLQSPNQARLLAPQVGIFWLAGGQCGGCSGPWHQQSGLGGCPVACAGPSRAPRRLPCAMAATARRGTGRSGLGGYPAARWHPAAF